MDRLKKYLIGAVALAIIILIGGAYYYFAVYRNSPEYAFQRIEYALEHHDKALFYEYVDTSSVLDSAYDSILKSLMDSDATMTEDAKIAALEVVKILKSPVLHGFQKAIDAYVENGSWDADENTSNKGEEEALFDVKEVITQAGIKNIAFRGIDKIVKKDNNEEAVALAKIYHNELEKEFVFEIVMHKSDKSWKIVEVRNFEEFIILIGKIRREKIQSYIEESRKIWNNHESKMHDADFDLQRILSAKSLGQQGTRGELKTLMLDRIAADWKARKDELEALNAPKEVLTLHRLRLKIADLHIEYAEGYATWLDDKKASTLRLAEDKIKQAKTLEQEAFFLEKRIADSAIIK